MFMLTDVTPINLIKNEINLFGNQCKPVVLQCLLEITRGSQRGEAEFCVENNYNSLFAKSGWAFDQGLLVTSRKRAGTCGIFVEHLGIC